METRLFRLERFSPMTASAMLAIIALVAVSLWQVMSPLQEQSAETVALEPRVIGKTGTENQLDWQRTLSEAVGEEGVSISDPDGLSNIGGNVMGALLGSYVAMKESGVYTPEQGEAIAGAIASDLRANIEYRLYNASDLTTDPDSSLERMLTYRNDMRIALEPLLKNNTYELELFGQYLETGDTRYVQELEVVSDNYALAMQNAVAVVVPKDALTYHIGALNALSEFQAILERMASYADDTFASAALLRAFGIAETRVLISFDALASYYREHAQL